MSGFGALRVINEDMIMVLEHIHAVNLKFSHILYPVNCNIKIKFLNAVMLIHNTSSKTIGIHTDFHMFASILQPENKVAHTSLSGEDKTRSTGGQLKINDGIILKPGDGAFITEVVNGEEFIFESVGKEAVEFVLFDLA
uniref:Quercetin 2,3-dioxygenase C-terminal cupin domain-containing protein n=1 Tax=Rhizophagus irregularis (strain DAOM 181602 / DAOM 197198 / MUCL 43194) TaxID=747089 RepID=U9UBJ4_RHIID